MRKAPCSVPLAATGAIRPITLLKWMVRASATTATANVAAATSAAATSFLNMLHTSRGRRLFGAARSFLPTLRTGPGFVTRGFGAGSPRRPSLQVDLALAAHEVRQEAEGRLVGDLLRALPGVVEDLLRHEVPRVGVREAHVVHRVRHAVLGGLQSRREVEALVVEVIHRIEDHAVAGGEPTREVAAAPGGRRVGAVDEDFAAVAVELLDQVRALEDVHRTR